MPSQIVPAKEVLISSCSHVPLIPTTQRPIHWDCPW